MEEGDDCRRSNTAAAWFLDAGGGGGEARSAGAWGALERQGPRARTGAQRPWGRGGTAEQRSARGKDKGEGEGIERWEVRTSGDERAMGRG